VHWFGENAWWYVGVFGVGAAFTGVELSTKFAR